ncbi:MAG: MATE family efflux transporter [Alphaproteobacteria bacterium]|nr:MAG: MATE family efflux transporter [Alphaproteobacteria bacterium]
MSVSSSHNANFFLKGAIPLLFVKTAAPIILVMGMNGLFTVVDAYFLGIYVGGKALTAVTLMFPLYMLLVALSTLVTTGFASIYSLLLGAGESVRAARVFAEAVQLSLLVCLMLMVFFLASGHPLTLEIANGEPELAALGYRYISILIFCSPLVFLLAINTNALRSEGRLSAMAGVTLFSALLNIFYDYLFIARFGWGVGGSAWGTILAQACALGVLFLYLKLSKGNRPHISLFAVSRRHWRELLVLGAPSSLGYIGLSLTAGLTLYCLQRWAGNSYTATAGAYGIITRLMTFSFLPLLGLSMAFQTIAGNNFGARHFLRSNRALGTAIAAAFLYCLTVEALFLTFHSGIGLIFVSDEAIVSEVARILPYSVATMIIFGPMMIIGSYFQAIGDAPRAGILGLSRTYLFALPLTFLLPFLFGEVGIWYAGIVAELLVLLLTFLVLARRWRTGGYRWGLLEGVV